VPEKSIVLSWAAGLPIRSELCPGCTSLWRFGRTVGQHSIGMRPSAAEGLISHDPDRLASTRVRRAAPARDNRSLGTASPVPKYISSGVYP
jgi:hypothetical protein